MASPMLLRLVEGEVLELTSSVSDVLPQDVASLVGLQVRELSTRGDGACALHADFGSPADDVLPELHLQHPRSFLRSTLGEPLEVIRSRVRPTEKGLINVVVSALWSDFVLPFAGRAEAARNEEALFLQHLRRSPEWHRVVAAIALHRERQEAMDARDAIARGLSSSIFRRALDRGLWRRLTMTAGVEEEYASPPFEVRNGYCFVKGTNERYTPDAGGPETKYDALFDARAVFDGCVSRI